MKVQVMLIAAIPVLAATAVVAQHVQNPAPPSPDVRVVHELTLAGAEKAIASAHALARDRNAGGAIAVVDAGGHLVALHRIDGTFPAAAEVATDKARTAATFRKPTSAFEDAIKGGRLALVGVREMTPLQGGIPIIHDGFVVGAVGVSGAHSAAEDEEIAKAGAAAVSNESN